MGFRLWLEADEGNRPLVFCDMDETLIHSMEEGWLKDSKSNKNYAKMIVPGQPPYKGVAEIHDSGETIHVFPRPGLMNFLKEVTKFADIYVLTHSGGNYAEKVIKGLNLGRYIKDVFHTGKQKPNSLSKEFDLLERQWVLVDNLPLDTIEIINKMRILGLGHPDLSPKDEANRILVMGKDHFVKVMEWVPTADEYDDYEMWCIIPKIRWLLGIDKQQL